MNQFKDKIIVSVVRTIVPVIVGFAATYALKAGLHLNTIWLTDEVSLLLTTVFYALVRYLEVHVSPKFGWLLGIAIQPKYPVTNTPTNTPTPTPVAPVAPLSPAPVAPVAPVVK